jgi:hypothetical protein
VSIGEGFAGKDKRHALKAYDLFSLILSIKMRGTMKKARVYDLGIFLIVSALGVACQSGDQVTSVYTGNQTTYALQQASAYTISGTVTFKERKDGATTIQIALTGITDNDQHPVHLHLGDLTTNQASVAAMLSPVEGKTGQSETVISQLANDTKVSYTDLTKLDACVNVHLASVGSEANTILAAGNVGSAASKSVAAGRIGLCKSTF